MDIKFGKDPESVKLSVKKAKDLKPVHFTPRDELFQDLFTRCLKGDDVTLETTMIELGAIVPFSSEVVVPEGYIEGVAMQIRSGYKPEMFVYKNGEQYVMSDDYAVYYAYLRLGWKQFPVSVMIPSE